ncbi:importin-alpha export receptor [Scheffersomyces spartinae]|uniref:Importin-alpha export receptor n=1 Tax=Scheffersomyces spartinae TaxID=45513 RepID=A0A9P8AJB8_9ASCO|nr:importin-alpha export receptor [Scheffersomyces spartinae]KAG7194699.1 importin-alpha export receptor [Scheffersomyces spartinae]
MTDISLEAIPKYLEQTLVREHAKQAEGLLRSIETQPGFPTNLLHVIALTSINDSIRLAGALFFKNLIKRKWMDEDGNYLLSQDDICQIKLEILDVMIKLPHLLQVQIGEAISLIAESDFPHNWPNLIDALVAKLSVDDFVTNKGLLMVAHSIFKKWRPLFRSDELFLEIKLVLEIFAQPFLTILVKTDELIQLNAANPASLLIYLENFLLLVQIYYDLNCQDIPEFFEDNMQTGMNIMMKYLSFKSPNITIPNEDSEVDVIIKIKTAIIELVSLYLTRYADVFEPMIGEFITTIWDLINTFVTKQQKFDLLVVKALGFLALVAKMPKFQPLFSEKSRIEEIINRIILPNIYFRESDEEHFEDEPIVFVRMDLEGSELDSRRKSATDFLRELREVDSKLLSEIVLDGVNKFLTSSDWRDKDMAIYLYTALAAKGSVTNVGVTSTNVLADVVDFFGKHIYNDLVADSHPVLKTDAIRYILTFRNQLTKDQLVETLPLLIKNLLDSNVVVYTYAAITIERLLAMTNFGGDHSPVFTKSDLPFATELVAKLFNIILQDQTPEKMAENEFIMKCVMRVLSTAEDTVINRPTIISQLLEILKLISKNPSNPRFSHYAFESLALLIKYAPPQERENYISLILPQLLEILSQDVQEFVPYSFQILAYLLETYPKNQPMPDSYKQLVKPLMSPTVWEFRGNIPGVTRLLIAILNQDSLVFTSDIEGSLVPLFGVFQKLASSKVNDIYGFELLETILLTIPPETLSNYLQTVAIILLTRLSRSRTDKFVKKLTLFLLSLCCIPMNPSIQSTINADFVIDFINLAEANVFKNIFTSFILPSADGFLNLQDKKLALIGLSQMVNLTHFSLDLSSLMVPTIEQIAKNLLTLRGISKSHAKVADTEFMAPLNELDLESASFGSHFSRLASIPAPVFDPLPSIKNGDEEAIQFQVINELKKLANTGVFNQINAESQEILHTYLNK